MSRTGSRLETLSLAPNGPVPNSRFPVLIHRESLRAEAGVDLPDVVEATFQRHGWLNNWREIVYSYYHYHSTTHEALGIARGRVTLRLGGEGGTDLDLDAGDILVLPAGVSHNQIRQSDDLLIVGGYPEGRDWDLIRDGELSEAETREAIKRIGSLPIPARDPVTGEAMDVWRQAPRSHGIPF